MVQHISNRIKNHKSPQIFGPPVLCRQIRQMQTQFNFKKNNKAGFVVKKKNLHTHYIYHLPLIQLCQGTEIRGWRYGSSVKGTDCSCRVTSFNSKYLHGGSQLSGTPVTEGLTPSSSLYRHQTYKTIHKHTGRQNTYTHKIKINWNSLSDVAQQINIPDEMTHEVTVTQFDSQFFVFFFF